MSMKTRREFLAASAATLAATTLGASDKLEALTVVVMDPLAAPLSCPCVKGYAQRDYDQLGKFLESKIKRPVVVAYNESLLGALTKKTSGKADLIIGKDSVVRSEAKANKLKVTHVAALTGKDGATTQKGLIVVASRDPAVTADQLSGYQIIFGPAEADEKHGAALALLKELNVSTPSALETCVACSDGATKVLDLQKSGKKAATVISSYAQPLLEGCGTIQKGDLRVVGETDPVPFVAAFITDRVSADLGAKITAALLEVGRDPKLCTALETKLGFVDPTKKK